MPRIRIQTKQNRPSLYLWLFLAAPMAIQLWQSHTDLPVRINLTSSWMDMLPVTESLIRVPSDASTTLSPPEWHDQGLFYVAKEEISTGAFSDFLNDASRSGVPFNHQLAQRNGRWAPKPQFIHHPITRVSHQEAEAFCDWLSERTGWTMQLPNSFHWQAITQKNRPGLRYPWGWNRPESTEVYNVQQAEPTFRKTESTAIRQIVGNVYEWGEAISPERAVIRGGAWSDEHASMLDLNREFEQERTIRSRDIGFRIVGTPPD